MPDAPLHPCPRPHCRRLTRRPGYCAVCAGEAAKKRGTARERGYDAEWDRLSKAWLAQFPWCGMRQDGRLHPTHSLCVQQGVQKRAEVTDHIRSLKNGGDRLDPANLQSLCVRCNTQKGLDDLLRRVLRRR